MVKRFFSVKSELIFLVVLRISIPDFSCPKIYSIPTSEFLLILYEAFKVGWVSFQDFYGRPAYQKTAEISLYIDEKYRGKGLGRLILEYAIEKSHALGIENLLAFIFAHNLPSLSLFEKFGFELWANLKNIAELDGEKRSLIILGKNIKE